MLRSIRSSALATFAATTLCVLARANTYIVDASGGGDFTDLPPAILAAVQGDVLLVKDGVYSGISLDKRLVILGEGPGVEIAGNVHVFQIAQGSTTVLAGMTWRVGGRIAFCSRPVVLDEIVAHDYVEIESCSDVRVARSSITAQSHFGADGHTAVRVYGARVEVNECTALGAAGLDVTDPFSAEGGNGGDGLLATDLGTYEAELHLYRTHAQGGPAGDGIGMSGAPGIAGEAGSGVWSSWGARTLIAGTSAHTVEGGVGGFGSTCACIGPSGPAVELLKSTLRISGVSATPISQDSLSIVTMPNPPDPSLSILTTPKGGQIETFRVAAEPGSTVSLMMGRNAIVAPYGNLEEDLLVQQQRVFHLGTVDASGVIGFNFPISAALPQGFTFFAQAKVTLPGGELRYTNSVPLIVR